MVFNLQRIAVILDKGINNITNHNVISTSNVHYVHLIKELCESFVIHSEMMMMIAREQSAGGWMMITKELSVGGGGCCLTINGKLLTT